MLPYSNPGLTKDVYIVVNVFLSIKVFSVAKMFNFLLAFSQIVLQWSFHVMYCDVRGYDSDRYVNNYFVVNSM